MFCRFLEAILILSFIFIPISIDRIGQKVYQFDRQTLSFSRNVSLKFIQNYSQKEFVRVILDALPQNLRERARPFIPVAIKISREYELDPFWVLSIIWTESHFDHLAKSHRAASGLMQLMPSLELSLISKIDTNKKTMTEINIEIGAMYLQQLLKRFKGSHVLATIAYNMGPTRVMLRLKNSALERNNNRYLDKVQKNYLFLIKKYSG